MSEKLIACYYDGMTKEDAVKFLESVYSKKIKEVSVKAAVNTIKRLTGKDWN